MKRIVLLHTASPKCGDDLVQRQSGSGFRISYWIALWRTIEQTMPTVPHINKCVFRHLAPEISHFPKNLITTSVLSLVNSLRFENQSLEVPHTARLFKIASQRQSCRLNMLNRHDCRRRDVRLGNPSRRHTHTARLSTLRRSRCVGS